MTLHRLVVHERLYLLDEEGADRAAAEIVAAVRTGGDFVRLAPVNGPAVRMLVTPATPVRLEAVVRQPEEEPDQDQAGDPSWFDYDLDWDT